MKKHIHFDLVMGYFIAIVMVCQSYTIKASNLSIIQSISDIIPVQEIIVPNLNKGQSFHLLSKNQVNTADQTLPALAQDSLDFEVKVLRPRKFLLSFYKKQASDIFIKIYDVLGNLVHQERVSKRGKFKKEYDLSAYKNELYVIEVGDSTSTKTRRLFIG